MRGRQNSRTLRQQKSTSSVLSSLDRLDPSISQHQAQMAAKYAFALAQKRSSTDQGFHAGYTESYVSGTETTSQSQKSHLDGPGLTKSVSQRQNIQFTRSDAARTYTSRIMEDASNQLFSEESVATSRQNIVTKMPPKAVHHPSANSASVESSSHLRASKDYLSTLARCDVFCTPEDDIASIPSSYRRLPRPKSMVFPAISRTSISNSNGSDGHYTDLRRGLSLRTLRTPGSHNGLMRQYISSTPVTQGMTPTTIQMAQEQFLDQIEKRQLKEQTSFLSNDRRQTREKPFRKTLRGSMSYSKSAGITPDNDARSKDQAFRDKARKISETIRNKLSRLFRRSRGYIAPIQGQEAVSAAPVSEDLYENIAYKGVNYRVRSHENPMVSSMPTSNNHYPCLFDEQLQSSSASETSSANDKENEESRITSWGSTIVSSTIEQGSQIDVQREKQLQISGNRETHSTTASSHQQTTNKPTLADTSLLRPVARNHQLSNQLSTPIDSARVYSALMRRLNGKLTKEIDHSAEDTRIEGTGDAKAIPALRSLVDYQSDVQKDFVPVTMQDIPRSAPSSMEAVKRGFPLSPQDIAALNEKDSSTLGLYVNTTLPRSIDLYTYRNSSPVLGESLDARAVREKATDDAALSSNLTSQDADTKESYTESIYSRTTSGQTPEQEEVTAQIVIDDDTHQGMPLPQPATGAAIITSRTLYRPKCPNTVRNRNSPHNSNEWRQWVSSEMSKIEGLNNDAIHPYRDTKPTASGHIREGSQINNEDGVVQLASTPTAECLTLPDVNIPMIADRSSPAIHWSAYPQLKTPTSLGDEQLALKTVQSCTSFEKIPPTTLDDLKRSAQKMSPNHKMLFSNPSRSTERSIRLRRATTHHNSQIRTAERHLAGSGTPIGMGGTPACSNLTSPKSTEDVRNVYGADLTEPLKDPHDTQRFGSKCMVDLFLSSRCSRTPGSTDESDVFL